MPDTVQLTVEVSIGTLRLNDSTFAEGPVDAETTHHVDAPRLLDHPASRSLKRVGGQCDDDWMATSLNEPDRPELLAALQYQRAAVRSIVDGMSEDDWHTSVVPSGWTPAGLVAHLGGAERHWTCDVILDHDPGHAFDGGFDDEPYDPHAPFVIDWPSSKVLTFYRDQTAQTDGMLARTALGSTPQGRHGTDDTDQPSSVREIVLHLIEETAAHSGHLEIARELLDGKTRLGLR